MINFTQRSTKNIDRNTLIIYHRFIYRKLKYFQLSYLPYPLHNHPTNTSKHSHINIKKILSNLPETFKNKKKSVS